MLILFRALLLFDSYSWAFLHYNPHLIDRTLVTSAKKGSFQRNTDVQRVTDVQSYQPKGYRCTKISAFPVATGPGVAEPKALGPLSGGCVASYI